MNSQKITLDIEEIKQILPHRYPFILIDRVIEFESNKRLVAIKNVSANEQFFTGHFPELKVMPGVLIIEVMAQAGIILFAKSKDRDPSTRPSSFDIAQDEPRVKSRGLDSLRVTPLEIKNSPRGQLIYYLGKVEAKFISPVYPGDQLRLEARPLKLISTAGIINIQAFIADKLVAEAKISFGVKNQIDEKV